ncbi:MAG: thioesterase family protein [Magnetospirillum sp.]|nr:thioesterase family protein [Magnetospirillum sp.]
MISAEVTVTAQFYDVDPMQVVWHGNYARFFEVARCALLDRIGYNYTEMAESGYMWPIVDMRTKFVRPVRFTQTIRVEATLVEYENRLRIAYRVFDARSGEVLTKAETIQVAVDARTHELCLICPPVLVDKVKALLP